MTMGGIWHKKLQHHPQTMSSLPKTPSRPASAHQFGRIQREENRKRFHWRFVPGSKAALDLAYDPDLQDDIEILPEAVVGRARRRA